MFAPLLVVLGPSKLPEVFRFIGKTVGEFRRMSSDVKSTLEREIERVEELKRIEETKNELFGDNAASADAQDAAFGPGHAVPPAEPQDMSHLEAQAPATGTADAPEAPQPQTGLDATLVDAGEQTPKPAAEPTREELMSQGFGTGHTFAPFPTQAPTAPGPGQTAQPEAPKPADQPSQDKNHA